jgi:hypothetical protein
MTRRLCIRQRLLEPEHHRADAVLIGLTSAARDNDLWSRDFKFDDSPSKAMAYLSKTIAVKALNERASTCTWIKRAEQHLHYHWWCDKGSIHKISEVINDALAELHIAFNDRSFKGTRNYLCDLRKIDIIGSTTSQLLDAIKNGYPIMTHEVNEYRFICEYKQRRADRKGIPYIAPPTRNSFNWLRIGCDNIHGKVEMGIFTCRGLPVSTSTDELIPLFPPANAGFIWAFVLAKMFSMTCLKSHPLGRAWVHHRSCLFIDISSTKTKKVAGIVRDAIQEAERCYDRGCLSSREQFARQCYSHNTVARVSYYTDSLGPRISPRPGPDGKDMYVCLCDNCKANLAKKIIVVRPVATKRRRVECS